MGIHPSTRQLGQDSRMRGITGVIRRRDTHGRAPAVLSPFMFVLRTKTATFSCDSYWHLPELRKDVVTVGCRVDQLNPLAVSSRFLPGGEEPCLEVEAVVAARGSEPSLRILL